VIEVSSVDNAQAEEVSHLELSLLDFLKEWPCPLLGYLRDLRRLNLSILEFLLNSAESKFKDIVRLEVLLYARLDLIPYGDFLPLDFPESACDDLLLLDLFNLSHQSLDVQEAICIFLTRVKLSGDFDGLMVKMHTVCVSSAPLSYL
jgi:hypothetical protein